MSDKLADNAGEENEAAGPEEPQATEEKLTDAEEIARLKEQLKRVAAESDNFRRRQEANFERRLDSAKDDIFRKILPVIDNLEMAIKAAEAGGSLEAFLKGVELVHKNALSIFESFGIQPIKAEGEIFNPNLHEAVMVEERDDLPDETVTMELKTGYMWGERVLRPSMVKVARKS